MTPLGFRSSCLGAAPLIALASLAHAQVAGSIEPLVGYYRPFGSFDPASVYSTALPRQPSDLQGFAWGAAANLVADSRFGATATLTIVRTQVPQVLTPAGPRGPTDVHVLIGTVEGRYELLPRPTSYRLWVGLGPAVVRHGGDAYSRYGSPSSFGGAVSLEAVVPLSKRLEWATGASAVGYVLNIPMPPELRANPGKLEHGNQRDVVFRTGLAWRYR